MVDSLPTMALCSFRRHATASGAGLTQSASSMKICSSSADIAISLTQVGAMAKTSAYWPERNRKSIRYSDDAKVEVDRKAPERCSG